MARRLNWQTRRFKRKQARENACGLCLPQIAVDQSLSIACFTNIAVRNVKKAFITVYNKFLGGYEKLEISEESTDA